MPSIALLINCQLLTKGESQMKKFIDGKYVDVDAPEALVNAHSKYSSKPVQKEKVAAAEMPVDVPIPPADAPEAPVDAPIPPADAPEAPVDAPIIPDGEPAIPAEALPAPADVAPADIAPEQSKPEKKSGKKAGK
jgi:hypothetical protein